MRSGSGIAQHGEGGHGTIEHLIVGFGKEGATHGTGSGGVATDGDDFVLELHDDALGSLASDALDHLEQFVVARADDLAQLVGVEGREDGACRVASDARHRDEQEKELALALIDKAVEHVGIFADGFVDIELHLRTVLDGRVGVE